MPAPGFLQEYLAWMRSENPAGADRLEDDLRTVFTTDEGLRVLKLFEKSTVKRPLSNGAPDSALREINAVRNFILEIERIVAHG